MRRLIGFASLGAGAAGVLAFCAISLSDARLVVAILNDPIQFLALPSILGSAAGVGASIITNRAKD